jgi:hypothetical protein
VQPNGRQPSRFKAEPETINLEGSVDAKPRRKPVVILSDDLDLIGKREGSANRGIKGGLMAAECADLLIEIMKAAKNSDAKVRAKQHIRAHVHPHRRISASHFAAR